jgi:hypothetical protein
MKLGQWLRERNMQQALAYAQMGWAVFPLVPGEKRPLTEHGFKNATTDETQIRAWWSEHPDAGIGVATGSTSGIVVIDVDPRHDGDASLRALVDEYGDLEETPETLTGGGGSHFIFRYPEGGIPSLQNLRPGIDLKSHGGYIVAPPSKHPDGPEYRWVSDLAPWNVETAPLPAWIVTLARKRQEAPNDDPSTRRVVPDETIRDLIDIIARYWEPKARHELAKGIAGYFAMQGTGRADAEALIAALTEDDEEQKDRFIAVRDTWRRARDGQPVKGRTTLVDILGTATADAVAEIVKRAVQGAPKTASAETDKQSRIRPRAWTDIRDHPLDPPTQLIDRLILADNIAMIAGPTYGGKSTVALDLAVSIASGIPALSHPDLKVRHPGPIVYFYGEQGQQLWELRLRQIAAFRGVYSQDLPITIVPAYELRLNDPNDLSWIIAQVTERHAVAAVFDPLALLSGIIDENDAVEAIKASRLPLQRIVNEARAVPIVVHHSSKAYQQQQKEPVAAAELVRGSGDLIAMTGSLIGVWYNKGKDLTKVLAMGRLWTPPPFALAPKDAPPLQSPEGKTTIGEVIEAHGQGVRPLAYAGLWEASGGAATDAKIAARVTEHWAKEHKPLPTQAIADLLELPESTVKSACYRLAKPGRDVLTKVTMGRQAAWTPANARWKANAEDTGG